MVGLEGAFAAVRDAVDGALQGAGADPRGRRYCRCVRTRRLRDWPSDHERLTGALRTPRRAQATVTIVNDTVGALRAGTDEAFGIASVAGTGGSTTGRNRDGATFRTLAITWGEGSGASGLVREGAARHGALLRTRRRRRRSSTDAWCRELGYADAPALFEALSRHDYRAASPALCPLVTACARDGDDAAMRVVRAVQARSTVPMSWVLRAAARHAR